MIKTTLSLLALTGILLATACGSSESKDNAPAGTENAKDQKPTLSGPPTNLEGTWEVKRALSPGGAPDSLNLGTIYEFKGSKLSFSQGSFVNPGSTAVTDTTFSFQADGNELKFMYRYQFNADTLVVEMMNSGGQTFFLVKK